VKSRGKEETRRTRRIRRSLHFFKVRAEVVRFVKCANLKMKAGSNEGWKQ